MDRGICPGGGIRRNTVTSAEPKLLHPDAAEARVPSSSGQSFYGHALPDEEREIFESAQSEHGLNGEIALLRLHLFLLLRSTKTRTKTSTSPATVQLTMRLIDLIVKALRAHGTGGDTDQSALEQELERAAAAIQQRADTR